MPSSVATKVTTFGLEFNEVGVNYPEAKGTIFERWCGQFRHLE